MKYVILTILLLCLGQHCNARKQKFAVIGGGNSFTLVGQFLSFPIFLLQELAVPPVLIS